MFFGGVNLEFAEKAAEPHLFDFRNVLIREQEQVMVQKCLLDNLEMVRVNITFQARTAYASTQWCLQRRDFKWHYVVL